MMMKSTKRSSAPITVKVIPVMYPAFQVGMKVMRYFSDPMRIKREADSVNEITKDTMMLIIMLVIRSFLRLLKSSLRFMHIFFENGSCFI